MILFYFIGLKNLRCIHKFNRTLLIAYDAYKMLLFFGPFYQRAIFFQICIDNKFKADRLNCS